jgi:hypothetical protein
MSRWPRGTLYLKKFAITSPTSGGRSVGVVRSRTQTMEFFFPSKMYTFCPLPCFHYLNFCNLIILITKSNKTTVRNVSVFILYCIDFTTCFGPSWRPSSDVTTITRNRMLNPTIKILITTSDEALHAILFIPILTCLSFPNIIVLLL